MSDSRFLMDETLTPEVEPSGKAERYLKRSVGILCLILVVELVWYLAIVPCLPLKTVDLIGAEGLNRTDLLAASGLSAKSSFFSLRRTIMERGLETIPAVESARVVSHFPDAVRIELVRRSAVAVSLAESEGRTILLAYDRNGVVFKVGTATDTSFPNAPVVSGLRFEQAQEGMRLPAFLSGFLNDLARLKREFPALLETLSEIRVVKRAYDGYELVLYPANRRVRVRIGPELNEEALRYMMLMLDVLDSKGIETDELDFRTGTASYRAKEG